MQKKMVRARCAIGTHADGVQENAGEPPALPEAASPEGCIRTTNPHKHYVHTGLHIVYCSSYSYFTSSNLTIYEYHKLGMRGTNMLCELH